MSPKTPAKAAPLEGQLMTLEEVKANSAVIKQFEEVGALTQRATDLVITSDHDYEVAAETMMKINTAKDLLEKRRAKVTKSLNEALREIRDLFKRPLEDLEEAKQLYRVKLGKYNDDKERAAAAASREAAKQEAQRLQEIEDRLAREREEQAQRELADQLERERLAQLEADAQRVLEAARQSAAQGETPAEDVEAAQRLANKARIAKAREDSRLVREEEERQERLAALEREKAPVQMAIASAPPAPKVSGVAVRAVWRWEVKDAKKIPANYYVLDTAAIDRQVQQLKGDAQLFFGDALRVWSESSVAGGKR